MNKLTILTIVVLAVFNGLTYSQPTDSLKAKRVTITTSVLEYLPSTKLNTGNFNIGTEIYLGNRNSCYANIGLIKSYGQPKGWLSVSSLKTTGIKIQAECKHFLNKHKIFEPIILLFSPHCFQYKSQILQNTGYYVALNSSYQWTATHRKETIVDYINDDPFPNSKHYKQNIYRVDRNVYGLNLKFGYQCVKKFGLTIDFSVGIGGLYIASHSTNRIGEDTDWPNSQKDFPSKKLFDEGTGFSPNILYHFRIGWGL
jgi:hypothetical protein